MLHASHEFSDLTRAVFGEGVLHNPHMLKQADVLPCTVLAMLTDNEKKAISAVSEAFLPLHKKADELLVRLKSF